MAQWSMTVAPDQGARLSSLRDPGGREWLWHNPDPALRDARARVQPGDPFVDAGGWEECFPTIAGASDHGEVWSRPWAGLDDTLTVTSEEYTLHRAIQGDGPLLTARYRLQADPGFRFIWAAHITLDLSLDARLETAPGTRCRLWPDHWLVPEPVAIAGPWPAPRGAPLDRLPHDGTALFFMLLDPATLTVSDSQQIALSLDAPGQPTAVAIWRNLGAWPPEAPYRSIGIEPAIGRHYDRDLAASDDQGVVGPSGEVEWTLRIEASEPATRDR